MGFIKNQPLPFEEEYHAAMYEQRMEELEMERLHDLAMVEEFWLEEWDAHQAEKDEDVPPDANLMYDTLRFRIPPEVSDELAVVNMKLISALAAHREPLQADAVERCIMQARERLLDLLNPIHQVSN